MPDPSLRAGLEHLIERWQLFAKKPIGYRVVACYGTTTQTLEQCALEVADLLRAQPPPAPDPPRWVYVNTLAVQQHVQAGHRMTCDCGADFQFAELASLPAVEGTRPPDPETSR